MNYCKKIEYLERTMISEISNDDQVKNGSMRDAHFSGKGYRDELEEFFSRQDVRKFLSRNLGCAEERLKPQEKQESDVAVMIVLL